MSNPKTVEEVREIFLNHVQAITNFWATLPDKTPQERCDGVAFSLLAMIDGANAGFPAMDISLAPHPEDKEFHEKEGEDYFEPGQVINDCQLHELFCSAKKRYSL